MKLKSKLFRIIFHTDTFAGKIFDIFLLFAIIISVVVLMLETIPSVKQEYGNLLLYTEWIITIIFTIEYVLRIIISHKTLKYVTSFWGVIDLLSVIPTYIAIFITGTHLLAIIRVLRLLRVFRVLNLPMYMSAGTAITIALKKSKTKIGVFLYTILVVVVLIGTLMYYVEGIENGFSSIPRSIYWAIVTLTTVGYGDISPQTSLGQFISSIIMILGYAIIAVPTGIVSAEMVMTKKTKNDNIICKNCSYKYNNTGAIYCSKCGNKLNL